jgi:hypothetical protein
VTLVFDFSWFAAIIAAIVRMLIQDAGGSVGW